MHEGLASLAPRARAALASMAWAGVAGIGASVLLICFLLSLGAAPGGARAMLAPLACKAWLILVCAKLAVSYAGPARYRACASLGGSRGERLAALLPRLVLAWPRMEAANLRSCFAWLGRRRHPAPPPGQSMSFMKNSAYSTVIAIMLVSIFIELPLHTLIMSVVSKDPEVRHAIQLALAGLAAYSLLWLCGDRYAMRGSYLVLDAAALHIRIGNRFHAVIPRAAIRSCAAPDGSAAGSTLIATPADFPNIVLGLDTGAALQLSSWQLPRPAPQFLKLYLDQPAALIALPNHKEMDV